MKQRVKVKLTYETFLFVIVCMINLFFVYHHVCARDEAQAWLIAKDNTLKTLFNVTSYEGHPCLWFLVLMPFARNGLPYISIKLISFTIMSVTLALILFKLSLPRWAKTLAALSPMCIGEFVTPARCYCLCAFFMVLLTLIYNKRNEKPISYGILLSFLLQTHIVMGGFVIASCLAWSFELLNKIRMKELRKDCLFKNIIGLLLPLASALFLLWEFRDIGKVSGHSAAEITVIRIISKMIKSLWGQMEYLFGPYCVFPMMIIIALLLFCICRRDGSLIKPSVILVTGLLWLVWINAFVYHCHFQVVTWMYLFLWFFHVVFCNFPELQIKTLDLLKINPKNELIILVSVITLTGVWIGIGDNVWRELLIPYSASKDAAEFLNQLPDDIVIIENDEEYCCAVVPYLKNKVLFDPFKENVASYIDRNPDNKPSEISLQDAIERCQSQFPEAKGIVILCSSENNKITVSDEEINNMVLCWSSMILHDKGVIKENYDIRYLPLGL